MIRPFTLITAMLFVLSGAYLFAVKHRSQMLEDQIAQVTQATRLDAQRIRVLQAQWALEADPSRLTQLSTQFTNLQPMKPSQLVTLASLTTALPAPGSPVPGPNPEDVMPAITLAAAQAAPAPPQPPAPSPVKLASAAAPGPMANVEALLRTLPVQAPHHPARVRHAAAARELALNRPAYNGGSALAPLAMSTPEPLLGAQVMRVRAVSPVPEAPPAPMPAYGGSMLGMAQAISQGGNNN
jgi:hypothetical protein